MQLPRRDRILFVSWLLGALVPGGPYPLLFLVGQAGAGKSTLARLAHSIVDPINGELLAPSKNSRDFIALQKLGHVLAFDNVSKINSAFSDDLCRLATGGEFGGRCLYTNFDAATVSACKPTIITCIPDLVTRADLATRALLVRPNRIEGRKSEREWRAEAAQSLPSIMGALFDALAAGLKGLDEVPTPQCRMADFAKLVVSAESKGALPWEKGAFLEAYEVSRKATSDALIENSPVAYEVKNFMEEAKEASWTGPVSTLCDFLRTRCHRAGREWKLKPSQFSAELRQCLTLLEDVGIYCSWEVRNRNGRPITIRKSAELAASATPAA